MTMFLEHEIEDKNFLRYIRKLLKSGILEDHKYYESDIDCFVKITNDTFEFNVVSNA